MTLSGSRPDNVSALLTWIRLLALSVALATAVSPGTAAAQPLSLIPVLGGLEAPVYVTHSRDGTGRLFVVEQPGRIRVLQPGASAASVFLDISGRVLFSGEQGLLGLAFHPQYAANGRFFVNYTRRRDGRMVVAEYRVSAGDANVAVKPGSVILRTTQPFGNHKGGMIEFGHDGFLYIALGDGGAGDDPGQRAQNPEVLLGKILRIDVDHPSGDRRYSSPASNPFVGGPGRDEIFALGFRNPYRFSFDRATGALYVGDVGQGAREEVAIVQLGQNHGWRVWEGTRCTGLDPCADEGYTFPVAEYDSNDPRCAVIGGYVYRGAAGTLPAGTYLYGDFCSGEVFSLAGGQSQVALASTGLNISSFGEDGAGEPLVVDLNGGVYRIAGPGGPCSYAIAPGPGSFPAAGGSGSVHVTSAPGCPWTAVSDRRWLDVGGGGHGSGAVQFSVRPNPRGNTRRATLTVAGHTLVVSQAGVPCTLSVSVSSLFVPAGGGVVSVDVAGPKGCPWTAASPFPWLTVAGGLPGRGPGAVTFQAAPRPNGAPRLGFVTVAGHPILVIQ